MSPPSEATSAGGSTWAGRPNSASTALRPSAWWEWPRASVGVAGSSLRRRIVYPTELLEGDRTNDHRWGAHIYLGMAAGWRVAGGGTRLGFQGRYEHYLPLPDDLSTLTLSLAFWG